MSVLTLPIVTASDAADDDLVHYFCCDEDRSLCGLDISAEPEVFEAPDERRCAICVARQRLRQPCAVPGCPYRIGAPS